MARFRLKSAAVINGENKSRILVRVRQLLRRCEETDDEFARLYEPIPGKGDHNP